MATIQEQQTQLLQSTGTENIKFTTFNYEGIRTGSTTKNILKTAPDVMKPINANLSVEHLRPLKSVLNKIKLTSVNVINKNPTF